MGRLESDLSYGVMCFWYKMRDFFSPPLNMLKEADIKPGYKVLDFGCGPGGYSITASRITGDKGRVYALDIHPAAIERVRARAEKEKLDNLKLIQSDGKTGLDRGSINVVLMYDVFHDLDDKAGVLKELHRVLKPGGTLSFSDHHMGKEKILAELTGEGLFRLKEEGSKTYSFVKI